MSTLWMMIGLPASGKSTWRDDAQKAYGAIVASSDDYIEAQAQYHRKTYNDVFQNEVKNGEFHCKSQASYAIMNNIPLIWDQTNLTIKSRRTKLVMFPTSWKKIAVVVKCTDFEEWKRRLMNRPGKLIPVNVIQTMMKSFEMPTIDEGFHSIMEINT